LRLNWKIKHWQFQYTSFAILLFEAKSDQFGGNCAPTSIALTFQTKRHFSTFDIQQRFSLVWIQSLQIGAFRSSRRANMRNLFIVLSGLASATVGNTTIAQANSHLNCQVYAQSVIDQANENAKFGCGFSGPVWSTDFNFHVNWCNQNTTQMHHLTEQQAIRTAALSQCKLTKPGSGMRPANAYDEQGCDSYAKQMVANAQTNIVKGCGINDPRMHQNYQAHFDWCFNGRTKQQVKSTLDQVIASVNQCTQAQNTIILAPPTIGFTPKGKPKVQIQYNYCDRLIGANKKCGKPVADQICQIKGYGKSTAHKKGKVTLPNWMHSSYFIGIKQGGKGMSEVFDSITCTK
jgi:hypothetical protein